MKKSLNSEQLEAIKQLVKIMLKYDLRFQSDDPYCGVDIRIGNDCFINADFKNLERLISEE